MLLFVYKIKEFLLELLNALFFTTLLLDACLALSVFENVKLDLKKQSGDYVSLSSLLINKCLLIVFIYFKWVCLCPLIVLIQTE